MSTMISEVYDAFIEAGMSEEKARKAAEAVARYENRFAKFEADLVAVWGELTTVWRFFAEGKLFERISRQRIRPRRISRARPAPLAASDEEGRTPSLLAHSADAAGGIAGSTDEVPMRPSSLVLMVPDRSSSAMTDAARARLAFVGEEGSRRTDLVHSPEVARLEDRREWRYRRSRIPSSDRASGAGDHRWK